MLSIAFFLAGIVLFHIFRFFPVTVLLLGLSAAGYSLANKRFLLLQLLLLGAAYAFLRFSPPVGSLDVWDRELRLTGHFVSAAHRSGINAPESFRIDTTIDDETGEEIEGLHEEEAGVFSGADDPGEGEYEILLKSGKEKTRLNPGVSATGRLYGTALSVGDLGGRAFSFVRFFGSERAPFLFAGDVEEEAEEDIARLGLWCRTDVLKMPHHGSSTSANEEFLSAASPRVAVISVGRENPFGHPSPEVIEKLSGMTVFRTDRDGAVKMTEKGKGLEMKTCREFVFEEARGPAAEWRNIRRLFSRW